MDLAVDDDHWRVLLRNVAECSRKARPNATLKYPNAAAAMKISIRSIVGAARKAIGDFAVRVDCEDGRPIARIERRRDFRSIAAQNRHIRIVTGGTP
jgi:hypothetical protein